jgi:putative hemolysin
MEKEKFCGVIAAATKNCEQHGGQVAMVVPEFSHKVAVNPMNP